MEVSKKKFCEFEKNDICCALACYCSQLCGARDNKGNPIYKTRS